MVKLRTTESYKFGQKNIVPYVGAVVFSETGEFEVEDEQLAKKLVDLNIKFEFVQDDNKIEKVEKDGLNQDQDNQDQDNLEPQIEDQNPPEGNKGEETEDDELKEQLLEQKMNDLKQIAADAGYPKEEWDTIRKKVELVEYILRKTKE